MRRAIELSAVTPALRGGRYGETVLALNDELFSAPPAGDDAMKTFRITPDFDQRMTVLTLFLVALACAIIVLIVLGMMLDRRERRSDLKGDQLRPWNRRQPPD